MHAAQLALRCMTNDDVALPLSSFAGLNELKNTVYGTRGHRASCFTIVVARERLEASETPLIGEPPYRFHHVRLPGPLRLRPAGLSASSYSQLIPRSATVLLQIQGLQLVLCSWS